MPGLPPPQRWWSMCSANVALQGHRAVVALEFLHSTGRDSGGDDSVGTHGAGFPAKGRVQHSLGREAQDRQWKIRQSARGAFHFCVMAQSFAGVTRLFCANMSASGTNVTFG